MTDQERLEMLNKEAEDAREEAERNRDAARRHRISKQ